MTQVGSEPARKGAGAALKARFLKIRPLGAGATAGVDLVYDTLRDETVALKRLHTFNPISRFKLKQEFRRVREVRHPHLVRLFDLFVSDDDAFFTMEAIVPGSDIVAAVDSSANRDVVDFRRIAGLLLQLHAAVGALHAAGLVHRDIKASNVLVSEEDRVVLVDFGFASPLEGDALESRSNAAGTIAYMAPESLWGAAPSPEADWYSFGVLAAELLLGRSLFFGSMREILLSKDRPPTTLRSECQDIPEDLDKVVCGLLGKEAVQRPSGSRVAETLAVLVRALPPVAHLIPPADTLFGREDESAQLLRWLNTATSESIVAVSGSAGIGKTALVRNVLAYLGGQSDLLVLQGRCYPNEGISLKGLDGVIESTARYLAKASAPLLQRLVNLPGLASLCSLFPVLARFESRQVEQWRLEPPADPQRQRSEATVALGALLRLLGEAEKLVVWLDDLHWADVDGVKLLTETIRSNPALPVTWILSMRDDSHPALSDLLGCVEREAPYRFFHLRLCSLTTEAAIHLALHCGANMEQAACVANQAQGSPFAVRELARDEATALGHAGVVGNALRARLSLLTPPSRALLELLALAAEPVPLAILLAFGERNTQGARHLQPLEDAGWIRLGYRDLELGEVVEVSHDRVRVLVLEQMSPERQRAGHLRLADTLKTTGLGSLAAVAYHYRAAGAAERGLALTLKAADAAAKGLAFERAAELYGHALAASPTQSPELMEKRAQALVQAGHCLEAGTVFLGASAAAKRSDPERARTLQLRAGACFLYGGNVNAGRDALSAVLHAQRLRLPRWPLAAAIFSRLRLLLRRVRFSFPVLVERSTERFDSLWAAARGTVMVEYVVGDALALRALEEALRLGDPSRASWALAQEAASEANIGGPFLRRRASALLVVAGRLVEQTGEAYDRAFYLATSGAVAWFQGRWLDAERDLRQSLEMYRRSCTGVVHEVNVANQFLAGALVETGKFSELAARVLEVRSQADQRGDAYGAAVFRIGAPVMAALVRDAPDAALLDCNEAMRLWPFEESTGIHYLHFYALVSVHLYRGDADAAWQAVSERWRSLVRGSFLRLEGVGAQLRHLRIRVALLSAVQATGSAQRWISLATKENQTLARSPLPHAKAWALANEASLLALQGSLRALQVGLDACARFETLGMQVNCEITRLRVAAIVGNDTSARRLSDAASGWFDRAGIVNRNALARLVMPFPDGR